MARQAARTPRNATAGAPLRHAPSPERDEALERFVAFQQILQRRFAGAMPREVHADMGAVTMHQLHALHAIFRHGHVTMGELAGCLDASSLSTATQMADRLVRLGLVERADDESDRRIVRLRLTPRARTLLDRFDRARRSVLTETFAVLDDRELSTLTRLLGRLVAAPGLTEVRGDGHG